jgi:hypothetical protein
MGSPWRNSRSDRNGREPDTIETDNAQVFRPIGASCSARRRRASRRSTATRSTASPGRAAGLGDHNPGDVVIEAAKRQIRSPRARNTIEVDDASGFQPNGSLVIGRATSPTTRRSPATCSRASSGTAPHTLQRPVTR